MIQPSNRNYHCFGKTRDLVCFDGLLPLSYPVISQCTYTSEIHAALLNCILVPLYTTGGLVVLFGRGSMPTQHLLWGNAHDYWTLVWFLQLLHHQHFPHANKQLLNQFLYQCIELRKASFSEEFSGSMDGLENGMMVTPDRYLGKTLNQELQEQETQGIQFNRVTHSGTCMVDPPPCSSQIVDPSPCNSGPSTLWQWTLHMEI